MYKKTCYSHYDPILETTVYARAPGIALTALIPRIFCLLLALLLLLSMHVRRRGFNKNLYHTHGLPACPPKP